MPAGAEESLEETDAVCGNEMPTWQSKMGQKRPTITSLGFIISTPENAKLQKEAACQESSRSV
jgi:hypothetical protein